MAGLFLGLAGVAVAGIGAAGRSRLAAADSGPIAGLSLAFPTGGDVPFVVSAFLPVPLLAAAALFLLPAEERALRRGVVLYAALCLALALVHTQVGANAARLGSLFGGPVLALGLARRRPLALALVAAAAALLAVGGAGARPVRSRRRSVRRVRPTTSRC